ncbi:hypothetical protein B0F89_10965 [Malaciobacter marinus]|jgi:uncharacterized membrane protein YozB (DUF420 family)|uniref:Uncharacterized protein n=1 Tax=Malaciobacter marinus TaxID=505249 RepID=A0AB36ZYK1_9BACT|nr:hypothetical protein B0F89_10965 [Malaciobacter marinus]
MQDIPQILMIIVSLSIVSLVSSIFFIKAKVNNK